MIGRKKKEQSQHNGLKEHQKQEKPSLFHHLRDILFSFEYT